jgi:hypothetical protein
MGIEVHFDDDMVTYNETIRSPEEHYTYTRIDAAKEGWRRYIDHRVPGLLINKHSDPNKRIASLPISPFSYRNSVWYLSVLIIRYLE